MSLESRIIALATAVGTDIKALTTNQGNLASLSTTAKSNLVAAINELVAQITVIQGQAGLYTNAAATPTTIGGIASGSTFNNRTWQSMFDALLYPYQVPAFSSFAFTGQTTPLEVGATVSSNRTFTWATSNAVNINTNSISIEYPVGTPLSTGLANDGPETVTHASNQRTPPGTEPFRIKGTNTQAANFQRDATVEWRWMRFSGNSAVAGPLSAVQIQGLSVQTLATDDAATYTFGAAAGTYKYIACPTSFGTLSNINDQSTNLDVPMEASYTVSVTNAFGQTTDYRVYRTTNQLGAAINIVASLGE